MLQCFELKQNVTRSAKCSSAFLWMIFTIEDICAKKRSKRVTIETGPKRKSNKQTYLGYVIACKQRFYGDNLIAKLLSCSVFTPVKTTSYINSVQ